MHWSCCGHHNKNSKGCTEGIVRINELFFFFKEKNNFNIEEKKKNNWILPYKVDIPDFLEVMRKRRGNN